MGIDNIGYLLIFFILIISIKIYLESDAFQLKCIISSVDGNKYCVRERAKLELASNKLANVTKKLKELVLHMGKSFPDRSNVMRLVNGFNPKKISETLPTSEYTAYSQENPIELCLRCVG